MGRVTARLLAAVPGARVVRWDQRGHGSSERGPRRPTIKRLGDDLATVVSQLTTAGDLALAGHSMGGMTFMACAGRYPELIAGQLKRVALLSTAAPIGTAERIDVSPGPDLLRGLRPAASSALPWVMRALAGLPGRAPLPRQRLDGTRAFSFGKDLALQGAGHMLPLERADDVLAELLRFAAVAR